MRNAFNHRSPTAQTRFHCSRGTTHYPDSAVSDTERWVMRKRGRGRGFNCLVCHTIALLQLAYGRICIPLCYSSFIRHRIGYFTVHYIGKAFYMRMFSRNSCRPCAVKAPNRSLMTFGFVTANRKRRYGKKNTEYFARSACIVVDAFRQIGFSTVLQNISSQCSL
jgi:hypothetical protein